MRMVNIYLLKQRLTWYRIGVTVQGKNVQIATGSSALSAIDTGTTLIGGPTADVQSIWAAVPGSSPLSGNMAGFYGFRMPIFYVVWH